MSKTLIQVQCNVEHPEKCSSDILVGAKWDNVCTEIATALGVARENISLITVSSMPRDEYSHGEVVDNNGNNIGKVTIDKSYLS